jgi:endonuclease YncB( thermonuclease family)
MDRLVEGVSSIHFVHGSTATLEGLPGHFEGPLAAPGRNLRFLPGQASGPNSKARGGRLPTRNKSVLKNEKIQVRLSEELLDYCRAHFENVSLFIREAMREKIESGLLTDPALGFIEIRCRTPFTYLASLKRVIDADTLLLTFDVGFFTKIEAKVRLAGINAPEAQTARGKAALAFVEKELTGATLVVETRKKEKYGRYLAYVYYSHEKDADFASVIRHGRLLNDELVRQSHANLY